jgi:hypothetical protein
MERPDQFEQLAIISDLMRTDPMQGELHITDYKIKPCKTWLGRRVM